MLSQPGQFAAEETIDIETPGGSLSRVRIIGPIRAKTQIEISQTDSRKLNINPPVRQSGDISGSVGAKIIGPKGQIEIKEGVIIAERHIHCDPESAKELGLENNQRVNIKTSGARSATFNNVVVRVHKDFASAFHIDTDEANAALDFNDKDSLEYGLIIK